MSNQAKISTDDALFDKALDGALASYTSDAPRLGFEDRLKARLAEEGALSRRPKFSLPWIWAGAAVFASIAGILVLVHRPVVSNAPPSLADGQHRLSPEDRALVPKDPVDSVSLYARINPPAHRPRPAVRAKESVRRGMSAIDAVSYQEMRAASHPAPEEPLTQEEKLLLRVVHSGDPQVMAMLNPEIREQQDAQSEAEFNQFVEQSIKGERE